MKKYLTVLILSVSFIAGLGAADPEPVKLSLNIQCSAVNETHIENLNTLVLGFTPTNGSQGYSLPTSMILSDGFKLIRSGRQLFLSSSKSTLLLGAINSVPKKCDHRAAPVDFSANPELDIESKKTNVWGKPAIITQISSKAGSSVSTSVSLSVTL